MTEEFEEKYRWVVLFHRGGRLYPYLNRTVPHMAAVVQKYYDEHAEYPYRMWVLVGDQMQLVEIS